MDSQLFFKSYGDGVPLVLLHGFCESHTVWEPFVSKYLQGYRVICPDFPGFGKSLLSSDITIEGLAEEIKSLTDHLQLEEFYLAGHSLGGYVSLAFAEKYPDSLLGLGLIHSTAQADTEEKKENRLKSLEFIRKHGVKTFIDTFVSGLFYAERKDNFSSRIKELEVEASDLPYATVEAYTLAMRMRVARMNVLSSFQKPRLFVAGKHDSAVNFENSLTHQEILKPEEFVILENSGHMGMIEEEENLASAFRKFLP